MNSLGRGCGACASALRDYWRTLRRVRRAIGDARLARHAWADLDRLLFDLDVDVGARDGDTGRERMSLVEAQVLQPTLVAVRHALDGVDPRAPPATWEPALTAASALVRAALPRLRAWREACREVCRVHSGRERSGGQGHDALSTLR